MSAATWVRRGVLAAMAAGMVLPTLSSSSSAAALQVDWGHCLAVVEDEGDSVCVYDPESRLRLWVDHPEASEARITVDGVAAAVESYELDEEPRGLGYRVELPPGAVRLDVRIPGAGEPRWQLALRQDDGQSGLSSEDEDAAALGSAMGQGDPGEIRTAALHLAERLLSEHRTGLAVGVLLIASFELRKAREFEVAAEMLEHAERVGGGFPWGRSFVATYGGVLRWSEGDRRRAAMSLREAVRYALRVEEPGMVADAVPIYAEALAGLGYHREARYWAQRALQYQPDGPCEQASVHRTAGWVNLVLRANDQEHDDPRPRLREAIRLYRSGGTCRHGVGGARLSLALLALEDGRAELARRQLDAIDPSMLQMEDRVRAADLHIRLLLAEGAALPVLEEALSELLRGVQAVDDYDARWRLLVRVGQVLARADDSTGALEALEHAERVLDELVRAQAIVGAGKTAMADRYLEGTLALVSLLVELDRAPQALCVAREARARRRDAASGLDMLPDAEREVLEEKVRRYRALKLEAEGLEARVLRSPRDQAEDLRQRVRGARREANQLVDEVVETLGRASASPRCEELTPAAPGELLVALYPRPRDWLIFASDVDSTEVHVVPSPQPEAGDEALGRQLLGPIEDRLEAASRVRVLAHREAQQIDVHLLPWRGPPLLAQRPVTYGVELRRGAERTARAVPRALLIADPTDTLTRSEEEIESVAERLRQTGWNTDIPVTEGSQPKLDFDGYALFHYAAHTAVDEDELRVWAPYPAGEIGGLPHLQIGKTARLAVHDILTMRPMPPVAFLAGCKTGVVELDSGSTSVALAFLLADARQVVASRENVADALAVEGAERFYESFVGEAQLDVAVAMHHVQRRGLMDGAMVPYRVWVR